MRISLMKLRKSYLAGVLATLVTAQPAWPQALPQQTLPAGEEETERYLVEVLIFRHTNAPDEIGNPGAVPDTQALDDIDHPDAAPETQTFGDNGDAGAGRGEVAEPEPVLEPAGTEPEPLLSYEPVPEEDFIFTAVEERMRSRGAYEPLLHVAWIQERFQATQAPAFRVDETYAGRPDLTGTIRFYHGRYPHLEIDLSYRPESLAYEYPDWQGYRLHEYRRMRDGEDHYFDNAHFGAIARVMPYEPEMPDALEEPAGSDQPLSAPR